MPPTAPAARGASSLMKSCQPCVGIPKPTAVYALSCATCVESRAAPSMREKALRLPPVSAMAMHIGTPISIASALGGGDDAVGGLGRDGRDGHGVGHEGTPALVDGDFGHLLTESMRVTGIESATHVEWMRGRGGPANVEEYP